MRFCEQRVRQADDPPGGVSICNLPCEYQLSKAVRDAGGSQRQHKFCQAHRKRRRLYGPDDPRTREPVRVSNMEKHRLKETSS